MPPLDQAKAADSFGKGFLAQFIWSNLQMASDNDRSRNALQAQALFHFVPAFSSIRSHLFPCSYREQLAQLEQDDEH